MTRPRPTANIRRAPLAAFAALAMIMTPATVMAQGEAAPDRPGRQSTIIGLEYTYSHFDDATDPWQLLSASVAHRRPSGIFIGRANGARRFGIEGLQLEADAYPTLGEKTYAYLNAGYSAAVIYPRWRYGGEVFKVFARGWEGSLGFRRLEFDAVDVTLFTGSIGRYVGNNWYSLRPFVRANAVHEGATRGPEASGHFTARHYFADPESYVGARIGAGSTPSDRLTPGELGRTGGWNVGLYGSKAAGSRTFGIWGIDYFREGVAAGEIRNRIELLAGVKLRY